MFESCRAHMHNSKLYNQLVNASAEATRVRQQVEVNLRGTTPGTLESALTYATLKAAEAYEAEMRKFVRAHPDHTYEGL